MSEPTWNAMLCDDLEKVFPRRQPRAMDLGLPLTGFLGERVSFQVAVEVPWTAWGFPNDEIAVEVTCPGATVDLSRVRLVPVTMPAYANHDENYLDDQPGLYPDLLEPGSTGPQEMKVFGWNSFWIDLTLDQPEVGPVQVTVTRREREWPTRPTDRVHELLDARIDVEVTPRTAPETPIRHIAWLHADGLATHYGTETWSEEHWTAVDNHIRSAAEMGVTSVLTPIWTPPLDTRPDTNRRNVQLLGIWHDEDGYQFSTELLDRYVGLLVRHGIRDVEVPHLFTQWGASRTPQIWVDTADGPEQRFGWHVAATDPAYRELLAELVPFLREHLGATFGNDHVLWHISDEPSEHHLETYRAAKASVADLLEGAVVLDALSSPQFAAEVDHPIVATNHVKDFLEAGLEVPCVYYCVGQSLAVSNRFIAQPAVGHRHLGAQMFVQRADTFLHWGYNFYNTQDSIESVDPFTDTCAGGHFPGGDPFVVYPGPDGEVWYSTRHRVLATLSADQRVMAWAEELLGREAVVALIDPKGEYSGTRGYEAAWPEPDDYRRRRLKLDRAVRAALGKEQA